MALIRIETYIPAYSKDHKWRKRIVVRLPNPIKKLNEFFFSRILVSTTWTYFDKHVYPKEDFMTPLEIWMRGIKHKVLNRKW